MGGPIETLADLFPDAPALFASASILPLAASPRSRLPGSSGAAVLCSVATDRSGRAPQRGFRGRRGGRRRYRLHRRREAPNPAGRSLTNAEKRHGVDLLAEKLGRLRSPGVIFPFKAAAVELVGRFEGNGWLRQEFTDPALCHAGAVRERRNRRADSSSLRQASPDETSISIRADERVVTVPHLATPVRSRSLPPRAGSTLRGCLPIGWGRTG